MKRLWIVLLVALSWLSASASTWTPQGTSDQEIATLVAQLSWNSVGGECNFVWRIFPDGEDAKKLIQIGKPATDELVKVLDDENRAVAAHLILTAIWEPEAITFENRVEGNNFVHVYNGLKWADVIKKKSVAFKVERADLIKNLAEWHRKLARLRQT